MRSDASDVADNETEEPSTSYGGAVDEEESDDIEVPLYFIPTGCSDLSESVGGAVSSQTGLQRIVSRCRCDFFYLYYDEEDLPDDRIKGAFDKGDDDEQDSTTLFKV